MTVLERDEDAIAIFRSFFLPLFDHPEKIHIVKVQDALTYRCPTPFDYLFADLHHDAVDGLPLYLSLMKRDDLAKEGDFWIEKAVLTYLRRHVVALLEEEASGYKDEDYQVWDDFSSHLLCQLHFHLKQVPIQSLEDVESLLSIATLQRLAKELKPF